MKKILTVTFAILLTGSLFAQVPFQVDKTLKVIDGVETEVVSDLTNVTFKMLSDLDHAKIVFENRDADIKVRSKKLNITNYQKKGDGLGGLRIYTMESAELGNVIVEEELYTMTGKIKIDRNRDGIYEEIFLLN
jgi:hypothetical protein